MKRLTVAYLVAILLVSTLSARAEIVSFGLLAGSSNAQYKIQGYSAISNRAGYQIGADITFQTPLISISPEVLYTNNKFKLQNSDILGAKCEVRDQSIDIPIVLGISFLGPFILEAGPVFSVYSDAHATFYGDYSMMNLGRIRPSMGYLAGVKLKLFNKIILGARYHGHRDYHSFGNNGYNIRSHSYSVSVGYIL